MEKVLISACLLGEPVRYHGGGAKSGSKVLRTWQQDGRVVALCPEMAGGLPVPRPPAELRKTGHSRVVLTEDGTDVTAAFMRGAAQAVALAAQHAIKLAVLKENSPSCGSHQVYDGTFSGRLIPGLGRTASELSKQGVRVFSEREWDQALQYLRALESPVAP